MGAGGHQGLGAPGVEEAQGEGAATAAGALHSEVRGRTRRPNARGVDRWPVRAALHRHASTQTRPPAGERGGQAAASPSFGPRLGAREQDGAQVRAGQRPPLPGAAPRLRRPPGALAAARAPAGQAGAGAGLHVAPMLRGDARRQPSPPRAPLAPSPSPRAGPRPAASAACASTLARVCSTSASTARCAAAARRTLAGPPLQHSAGIEGLEALVQQQGAAGAQADCRRSARRCQAACHAGRPLPPPALTPGLPLGPPSSSPPAAIPVPEAEVPLDVPAAQAPGQAGLDHAVPQAAPQGTRHARGGRAWEGGPAGFLPCACGVRMVCAAARWRCCGSRDGSSSSGAALWSEELAG